VEESSETVEEVFEKRCHQKERAEEKNLID
jgi:hypothetical protein